MSKRISRGEWMPYFGDDFWESERVAAMSDAAIALYHWLLWYQWKHGDLPPPEKLRRLSHRFAARWAALWPQVAPCFEVLANGRLVNARCASERRISEDLRDAASERARRGGLAKAARTREVQQTCSTPAPSRPQAQAEQRSSTASSEFQRCTGPNPTEPDKSPSGPPSRSAECETSNMAPDSITHANRARQARAADFKAFWHRRFREVTGHDYPWQDTDARGRPSADMRSLNELARVANSRAEIERAAENMFANSFWKKRGFSLSTLAKHFPEMLAARPSLAQAHAAPAREVAPFWRQVGFTSAKAYAEAGELAKQPKPRLMDLLAKSRANSASVEPVAARRPG